MTLKAEWEDFRHTVLHDFDEQECDAIREMFYSGALTMFDLLVLSKGSEDERLATIKTLSAELAAFVQNKVRREQHSSPSGRRNLYKLFRL